MTNRTYPKGMSKLLNGAIKLDTETISVALVTSGYTYSASHEFLNACGPLVGTPQDLTGKTLTRGFFMADTPNYGSPAGGETVKAAVIYKNTGNASTSPLIAYYDESTSLPFVANGTEIELPWDAVKKILSVGDPFYEKGGEKVLAGQINFGADTISAILLPADYTHDDAHEFLSDIPAVVGTKVALTGKNTTSNALLADPTDFGRVSGGNIGSILIFKDTGTPATSPLLLRKTNVAGVPLTTNGGVVRAVWNSAGVFRFGPAA